MRYSSNTSRQYHGSGWLGGKSHGCEKNSGGRGLAVADDDDHCHLALGLIRVVVCLRSFQLPRGGSTALQLILRVGCHLDVSGFLCYASLFLPFSIRSVFGFTQ